MTNILDLVKNKKFTEFSNAVRAELRSKLKNHPEIKKYVSEFDRIQKLKDKFKEIQQDSEINSNDCCYCG